MATKRVNYSEEDFLTAYKAVSMGVSLRKASALSNVPRSTLKDRINRNHLERRRQGPATLLTDDEEVQLSQWITCCWRTGFSGCSKTLISTAARTMLEKSQRKVRYSEFGKRWFSGFSKRHPRLLEVMDTKYVPQQASWKFGTEQLQLWFERIGTHLSEIGLDDVMQQPQRIFHCMEGKFKEFSVLLTYSASCEATPPLLALPPCNENLTMPKGWALYNKNNSTTASSSDDDALLLEHYLENVLYPYLVHIQVEFPIVIFLDYQRHPPTFKMLEICEQLNIVLINLYSMAFHKLRYAVKNNIQTWFDETPQNQQTRLGLIDAIKDALVSQLTKSKMKLAFHASGIYPFKIENVDTAHFMQTNAATPSDLEDSKSTVNIETANSSMDYSYNLSFSNFKNLIGLPLLAQLEQYVPLANIEDSTPEFVALHKIYKQFIDADNNSVDANVSLNQENLECLDNLNSGAISK